MWFNPAGRTQDDACKTSERARRPHKRANVVFEVRTGKPREGRASLQRNMRFVHGIWAQATAIRLHAPLDPLPAKRTRAVLGRWDFVILRG